jgi:Ca2+-binding RTX toxin-like protein
LRKRRFRAFRIGVVTFGLAAGGSLAHAGVAQAESCTYNPATKAVAASISAGSQATLVVSLGELRFGAIPAPCGGSTTTNTDSITIAGASGTTETLVLDHRGGFFGPGAAAESNLAEIEIATTLGDAADRVVVYGTEGPDYFAAGQNGFATSADGDVDITFAPAAFRLDVHLLGGDDYFNGRGESGAGLHFLGPIVLTGGPGSESLLRGSSEPDSIAGGPGNDVLRGQEANDTLDGGEGDDSLGGGGENDVLIGGPGIDEFLGSSGNDTMFADDSEADLSINGGPGSDMARVDVLDPEPVATEIVIRPSESCNFDGVSRALTLTMTPQSTATLVVVDGEIWFGQVPEPCGSATTTTTDSIAIEGAVGTTETLVIDERGGFFGPGATPESNTPEIEIATELGDASDRVIVYGTEDRDVMAAGQSGFATSGDGDVDITFSPSAFDLEVHLLGGDDHFDGRGTGGAGLKFLGDLVVTGGAGNETLLRSGSGADSIDGGPGNDVLEGGEGNDVLLGALGDDTMTGGGENDTLDGGPGIDTFNGNDGNDTFLAQDDEADASISGGAGTDTAYIDNGLDPQPIAVENVIGDDSPPPPTPGCTYDSGTRVVTAAITAGTQATLVVAGAEIRFGATPAACGAATTANTDTIIVTGADGSGETLTIDQTGGAFAPGATAEASGASEIEITALLGEASDRVVVIGTDAPETISVGNKGIALNADADADVTLSSGLGVVEMFGLGGPNTLTAVGGGGSGTEYSGKVVLHAGSSGDTLQGGLAGDELHGGTAADVLEGREGNDVMTGGAGTDTLAGGGGNDDLTGGAGADSLSGSDGDDVLHADDDEADTNLNGGAGTDTAYYDEGIDVQIFGVENRIAA